jgi:predicted ATPase/transcriptional regulator with XRE-family HTH domain
VVAMADGVVERFGELLRRRRRAAGLTQEELAERAGLSVRGIADLERGVRRTPRLATVTLLGRALGESPEDEAAFFAAVYGASAPPLVAASLSADGDPETRGDRRNAAASQTPHNLPIQPTALLGRDEATRAVVALARRTDARLVTLTGSGGIGKTRLAIRVANDLLDDFADGVWFVRLSRLTDPGLVIPTIAETLGLKEAGGQPIAETLRLHLRERCVLLVLDNCEHVAAAAPSVADLLATCPALAVLATSRTALHLRGEHEYVVAPLGLPPAASLSDLTRNPEGLLEYPAAALFVERARAVHPDFALTATSAPVVAEICARLDGLPLAIELAAVRVKYLPPPALLARLEHSLRFLVGGARDLAERQQAMRSTIAWSEGLLSAEERTLFRRLAVFAGGCTLEAAEAVCAAPEGAEPLGIDVLVGLGALVDHSLLLPREEGGEPRFSMLHVIREYALGQLDASGEAAALLWAHARWVVALAEHAEPELTGPKVGTWLARLEREHDNLRAALDWARESGEPATGLRVVAAVWRFWEARGHLGEGRAWVETVLASGPRPANGAASDDSGDLRARVLLAGGRLAAWQMDYAAAEGWLEQATTLGRATGNLRTTAFALNALGVISDGQGDAERAAARFEESLALMREIGDRVGIAVVLGNLGGIAMFRDDTEQSAAFTAEALALSRQVGDLRNVAVCLRQLGSVAVRQGDVSRAEELRREALALSRELGDTGRCAEGLEDLAATAGAAGQWERAARLLGAAAAWREAFGAPQPRWQRDELEAGMITMQAALGEEAWVAVYAAGHALSLDEAVAEALDEVGANG